jgi:hypothetical protein
VEELRYRDFLLLPASGLVLFWLGTRALRDAEPGPSFCDGAVQALAAFALVWFLAAGVGGGLLARASPDRAYRTYVVLANLALTGVVLFLAYLWAWAEVGSCGE